MLSAVALLALSTIQAPNGGNRLSTERAAPTTTAATLATVPPKLDGRDDDEVWRRAIPITAFREFQPVEDKDPRYATEARVAYDPHNFYVFVRMYDPHPDSIATHLARRDVRPPTDQIKIIIDSYNDRRTGYEFAVNPGGVKRDYSIYDDNREDGTWDGVWEVATAIDSLGWTAEFRIPLSQLRFTPARENTFGFGVWRDIERHSERVSWPLYRMSGTGLASQLGQVTGLVGLASPRRLEISPYSVARSEPRPAGTGVERTQEFTGGADVKYGLTSNLTLNATVNPDFGQVEADPAVLNLSAFETFFEERRPFFVEGTGAFQFPVNCNTVNCSGEALFYSRRIGRSPQLSGLYGDATTATSSTILGAGKLTGRLPSGLTVAALEAVTARMSGIDGRTIEPTTNYAVARVQQDLRNGETGVGLMFTAVNRDLDEWSRDYLRRDAYVTALNFRHRFAGGRYQVSGALDLSHVGGSPAAIAATQRSATHYYQRPDGALTYDPARTSLLGDAQEIVFGKLSGLIRFETSYMRRSPGFEINDLGFLHRADEQAWSSWMSLNFQRPTSVYRLAFWNFNWWQRWTASGLALERAANSNLHVQLRNNWWLHLGSTLGLGGAHCDRCARGGPAIRESYGVYSWAGFNGDQRRTFVPDLFVNHNTSDGGRSEYTGIQPRLSVRLSGRFNTSLGVNLSRNRNDAQWYRNITDSAGVTHYTFARLVQETASLTWRVNYTFTPDLTLQLYAQPFVSKGTYTDVREIANPRSPVYEERYQPYGDPAVTGNPGGFNVKQFRSNLVLRWEYRPGSTLYVVWGQGRQDFTSEEGTRSLAQGLSDILDLRADNTFLVKASYWINW